MVKYHMHRSYSDSEISRAVEILKRSKRLLFITGAGISADSGLPTYRGISGLYNDKDTEDGMSIETALSLEVLARAPEITWKHLARIEEKCRGARHNRAHEVIALMEKEFDKVVVFTQNIDGFHYTAGSKNVIDIHGDLHDIFCEKCGFEKMVKNYAEINVPPHCPKCGNIMRPDVVFFGEMLSEEKIKKLSSELRAGFDAVFSIGTTSVFPYIQEPVRWAKKMRVPTVEINPSETNISMFVDVKIQLGALEALESIWKKFKN